MTKIQLAVKTHLQGGWPRFPRIPVIIALGENEETRYSIDVRKIRKPIYRVKINDNELYVIGYETSNPDFELYVRSNEYSQKLLEKHEVVEDDVLHVLIEKNVSAFSWINYNFVVHPDMGIVFFGEEDCDIDECMPRRKGVAYRW